MQDLIQVQQDVLDLIHHAMDMSALEHIKVRYLGKKGLITDLMKELSLVSKEERPIIGQRINDVKQAIIAALQEKQSVFEQKKLQDRIEKERIDVTLDGRLLSAGTLHPVTQVRRRLCDYFKSFGFDIVEGPEVETDFYNFEALNIPSHHPARAMHDTFYFGDGRLLRTHTSPVQIRSMMNKTPPIRLIAPGRVYRCDSDMTHTPMFHQVEGLLIDGAANLAGLKALLQDFFSYFFDKSVDVRFRPSFFPFTEPSAEVDIQCTQCDGRGCRSCKFTGWLEVLGCGMVHPNVLKSVNVCPDTYQGWAFGMGLDRLAMLYYGVDDLRKLFENDLNFLSQF
jgi:phenylalanyl-tRNA synthetase alpha chain